VAVALTTDPAPAKPPYNWDVRTAYAICMAESRGNPNAIGHNRNGTDDRGLMQVNSIHADLVGGNLSVLYDPATNIKIAYSLSHEGKNWTAWSTYNNGEYRKFL
jgi:soluble lytic murein transglycosylase-like protein